MDTKTLIEVQDLRFRYPDGTQALSGVNFRLQQGETVALLGSNGSGKTTFLHLLVGLILGEGLIRIAGQELKADGVEFARRQVGLLFQDSNDQLFMPTVAEDVGFGPRNSGCSSEKVDLRINEALSAVGLSQLGARAPHHLSAGQKRLAALAGILAMEPSVILLDEPATFLDPPARARLIAILKDVPQAQILVTHDIDLALALAQRAVFFEAGRIVAEGAVAEVVERQSWR